MEPKLILEKELEPIFLEKFPAFPEGLKEGLAEYGPYVMLVLALIGIFGLLTLFGIGTSALTLGQSIYGFSLYVHVLIQGLILVLYIMAFKPLKARRKAGWNFLYYALLISIVGNLIQLNIIGAIIGAILGFWVLFQIREKYI
jgi:protein-S-isoprenylcysteine O-methyltransferase Ste14